jgi:hypothetical protein
MKLSLELPGSPVSSTPEKRHIPDRRPTDTLSSEICEIYDLLIGKGIKQNEAVRQTRAILKAINYPSATYDTVITRLRSSGRFRKDYG